MGWLVWYEGRMGSRKEIDRIFRERIVGKRFEVLKSCCRGYTRWCAAVKDKETGEVFAVMPRYHFCPSDGSFGYKWEDESYGPFFYNYPKSYFDLLTPTDIEFANEWREEMRKRYAQKENERKNKTRRN